MAASLRVLSLAAALALGGCGFERVARRPPPAPGPAPEESASDRELEMGFEFDQQILASVPLIDDLVVLDAVNQLGQSIVKQIEPQPFVYRFRVIVDPQLNAFAVPGGFVYLHSGTILAAGSVDELAGVLGHEIGHVKGRHIARMQEQATIPNLVTSIAGIAAAYATGEPGLAVAAQGINVALQLKYTREYEDEADQIGAIFMARAGFPPEGMVRFFERILALEARNPAQIPAYLYSHPQIEERVVSVQRRAEGLTVADVAPALSDTALREAQTRLAILVEQNRRSWPAASAAGAKERTDPLVAQARAAADQGRAGEAAALLARAEALDPADPSLPFQRAELLEGLGRGPEARAAYRRAVELDPTRPLPYYQLARAFDAAGDRVQAVYYLEHALRRFSTGGALQKRAQVELRELTFPFFAAAGIADGSDAPDAETPGGRARARFSAGDARVVWWGVVAPRWVPYRERIVVRWLDPDGRLVQEERARPGRKPELRAELALDPGRARAGVWRVEPVLEGSVVDRLTFRVGE
jgi:predicted Zn-dependent protease